MQPLSLTTPSLLFSAISLILLAYTNRFLSYAALVRSLRQQYLENPDHVFLKQIENVYRRMKLIRAMQILGVGSLLFCVTAMFFIYIGWQLAGEVLFGLGMFVLALSLVICLREVLISIEALRLNLDDIESSIKESKRNKRD